MLDLVSEEGFNLQTFAGDTIQKTGNKIFLDRLKDNFLTQQVREPTMGVSVLYLLLTNREGLV